MVGGGTPWGGAGHSLAVKGDGTLWATGNDDLGQLGDGTRTQTPPPVQVASLGGMATLGAGYLFSRATAVRQWATNYTYDHLGELVGTSGAGQQTASYTYDPAGNRTAFSQGATSTASTCDTAGRPTAVGPYTAASDADGNLTGLSGAGIAQAFAYDQANRLTGITTNGATTTNTYNGDGLRMSQTANGTTTAYVWDVNRSLPQVLSDGTRTYVYGLGLAYSVDASNNVQVYHTDGLGSVRALTNGSGSVVQTDVNDAFGNPTSLPGTQGPASQPFGFTGQQQDPSGLVYLRARYYAPALGRFMTRDPLAGSLGAPLSLNRYTYVQNDPTLAVDPSGMCGSQACKDSSDDACHSTASGNLAGYLVNAACTSFNAIGQGAAAVQSALGTFVVPTFFAAGPPPSGGGGGSSGKGSGKAGISGLARKIAGGHAWTKHVVKEGEFPGVSSKDSFAALVQDIIDKGTEKTLSNGRRAYWDDASQTVVITDPSNADGGTAFPPKNGKAYFDGLK